ncbi:class I SAM-dependent methyltransferase [Sphingosinicella sp. CPCC 101087]|uniref:class I SAM-dependent methyltransferase n=1 Tax=Sphingosinicella sp. CPCC 101087 TaxID=2497754 RepID=UPI00101CF3BE|nr:class I SAM-dependent methyltransferase [Sphingosinicella sp. CPCC 101087]
MQPSSGIFDDQSALWNGLAGRAWVDQQALLDALFRPMEAMLAQAAVDARATSVLDVGCGTGSTTLALARRVGRSGHCVGIDISEPMLDLARARAEAEGASAIFIGADAQTHAFDPASFDLIVSRFGVMFFSDPVAAFLNLRRGARDGARLAFIAWRGADENPFMTTAEGAVAPLLSNLPARRPDGPGQFAFADDRRVHAILEEGGWAGIEIRPIDIPCILPESALVPYITRLGPLGLVLQEMDQATRTSVVETARAAFDPYVDGQEVRFTAACWMASAQAT